MFQIISDNRLLKYLTMENFDIILFLKLTNERKLLIFINMLPYLIYMLFSTFLCYKFSRHRIIRGYFFRRRFYAYTIVQEGFFLSCIFHVRIIWKILSCLLDKFCYENTCDTKFVHFQCLDENIYYVKLSYLRISINFLIAFIPVLLTYIYYKYYPNYRHNTFRVNRINHHDQSELGRSIFFLQFPISQNVQRLLRLHDEYYLQMSGRPRKRRNMRKVRNLKLSYRPFRNINTRRCRSLESLPNLSNT